MSVHTILKELQKYLLIYLSEQYDPVISRGHGEPTVDEGQAGPVRPPLQPRVGDGVHGVAGLRAARPQPGTGAVPGKYNLITRLRSPYRSISA